MDKPTRDIILKSPTGSGKTIILTYFMHQYVQSYRNTVFVWLTPGKGNLEEQSKEKMDKYIHAAQIKLLSDVMTGGFEEKLKGAQEAGAEVLVIRRPFDQGISLEAVIREVKEWKNS